ncbi:MAG TPA: DUF4956 domain-containing protein [Thermoleophilaceae bacterium]|nr:DUF4956 domain-containing protein [Thermoleophilaceae bacterium]
MLLDALLRLGFDAAAIAVLAFALYYRRHGRSDIAVLLCLFNLGVFLAVIVIAGGEFGVSAGLGLFAVLSVMRMRSETFSSRELGYLFTALALAIVCAVDTGTLAFPLALSAAALGAVALLDHPRLMRSTRTMDVTVELVFADHDALRRHLEERLNVDIADVRVVEVDYVREVTRAELRCSDRPVSSTTITERGVGIPGTAAGG